MSKPNGRWTVSRTTGPAGAFHQLMPEADSGPEVWVRTIRTPALVLGSTQPDWLVDRAAAEADGVEVCQRRSGGGLVWIDPKTDCWVDVIVPVSSRLWHEDVGRAFHWLGDVWAEVFATYGIPATGAGHDRSRQGASADPAGLLWCFADLGHGELTINGSKILGLSQRRTRNWARLQCLVLGSWPGALLNRYVNIQELLEQDPDRYGSADQLDPSRVRAGFPPEFEPPDPAELADRFVAAMPQP